METSPPADPVPESPPPSLLAIARARLDELNHFLQTPHEPDPDFVHDLRVITRRLTEVARLVGPLIEKTAAVALVEALRNLRQSTGDLRDLDVLGEHLEAWKLPVALHGLRDAIVAELPAQRAGHVQKLRQEIANPTLAASLAFLGRILAQGALTPDITQKTLAGALEKTGQKRRKQLKRELGSAARQQTQGQFHTARIAVKKLRYSLELADESKLGAHRKELKFLKGFQGHLGDMHDTEVILQTLEGHLVAIVDKTTSVSAWRRFKKTTHARQGRAAAKALMQGYLWMNRPQ